MANKKLHVGYCCKKEANYFFRKPVQVKANYQYKLLFNQHKGARWNIVCGPFKLSDFDSFKQMLDRPDSGGWGHYLIIVTQ